MLARSGRLRGIVLEIPFGSDSIHTAEFTRQEALSSYVSFVIKFLAIHHNMGPVQCANTWWEKRTLQR